MARVEHVGWVQFPGILRVHYVKKRKSLCGRYAYWGRLYDRMRYGRQAKCAECLQLLEKWKRDVVYSWAEDAWLGEFDWKKKAGGES